jgi:hypothetical protein
MALAADVVEIDLSTSCVPFFHHVYFAGLRTGLTPNLPTVEARGLEAFHLTIFDNLLLEHWSNGPDLV